MSIVRRKEDRIREVKPHAQNGPGNMIGFKVTESDEELWNKGRLFNEVVLEKDCGVGYHVHQGDGEIYVILSGEAEYNDNGTVTTLHPGDITITGSGEGHSIVNHNEEPVYFMALILYED